MKTNEAIKVLIKALEKYKDKQTLDGPYIQIWPTKIEVVDCYGQPMTEPGYSPEEAADCLSTLD